MEKTLLLASVVLLLLTEARMRQMAIPIISLYRGGAPANTSTLTENIIVARYPSIVIPKDTIPSRIPHIAAGAGPASFRS